MKTRSQHYAVSAWNAVQKSKAHIQKNQYGGLAHKLPVLIQTCGLMQALAFAQARGQKSHLRLLDDLAEVLDYPKTGKNSAGEVWLEAVRSADLTLYIYLSTQAIEALLWFKRYAQSELGVDATTDDGTDSGVPEPTAGESA